MRPLPSISAEPIPRRANCAARMVPENPPPTIATGTRSDLIIGPCVWIGGARLAALDVVVDVADGPARRVREPAGHRGMDHRRAARTDQLGADLDRADAMARPGHAQRVRMFDEQPF